MPSGASPYAEVCKRLTRLWDESGLPRHELPTALAALIYLRWADFQEAELEAMAAFDGTDYRPVLPAALHWRSWHEVSGRDLQEFFNWQLSAALEGLNNTRHNPLATHLHRIAQAVRRLSRVSVPVLDGLVRWLAQQPFETLADRIALRGVLDAVLDASHAKQAGALRSPASVIRLMVALAAPVAGERVYDPCFGSAGLLTAACEQARAAANGFGRSRAEPLEVSGVDINPDAYLVGLTRLALTGIDAPQLELGNSLERPAPANPQHEGFDLVLANPPWGIRTTSTGRDHFAVKTPDVAGLFVQHALSQLRPGGRAIIVAPLGLLSRGGPDKRLRQWVLDQHVVEAVIGLPENAFLPFTSVRAALLVLRRNGPTRRIRMADAGPLFEKGRGREPALLMNDKVETFIRAMGASDPTPYGWDVDATMLTDVEWDLTPKRRDQSALDRFLETLRAKVEIFALQELCQVIPGRFVRSEDLYRDQGDLAPVITARKSLARIRNREYFQEFPVAPKESLITEDEIGKAISSLEQLLEYALDRHLFITWDAANKILFEDPFRFSKAREIAQRVNSCIPGSDALLVNFEGRYPHAAPVEKHLKWLKDRGYLTGDREEWIPYVRIKDIQQGWVNRSSAWIRSGGAVRFDPKWKLKAGDILVAKSGTVGKSGIVRNGAVGAIAASGLVVLRPDQSRLDPHFLFSYLASKQVRTWLDDRSRGATVRHLSLRTIREIPIPVPPLPIQQRVAGRHRDLAVDGVVFLAQLLAKGEDDPVDQWLDGALEYLQSEKAAGLNAMDMTPLLHQSVLGARFDEVADRLTFEEDDSTWQAQWGQALQAARDALRHWDKVPPGPALYALLQQAGHTLVLRESMLSGGLPHQDKARELTRIIVERIGGAMAALAADVRLGIVCDTDTLPPGDPATVEVILRNQGPLPLQDLQIATQPDWGGANIAFMAEKEEKRITLSGVTPRVFGLFSVKVSWAGRAFHGRPVEGQGEIAFNLVAPKSTTGVHVPGLGGSPYVCGDPVRPDRKDVFFGREELLDAIHRQVIQSGNVVLLEGNRRSGKSSILWHLAGPHAIPGWLGVYCSLQGAEGSSAGPGVPTAEVFREMAKSVAQAVHELGAETPLPDGTFLARGKRLGIARACRNGIGEQAPFSDFREYIEIVLELLQERDLGLLVMLDEFDKLQEGIDSGVTSAQVPENIRFLVQSYPRFCAILTGAKRLKRLREEYWSVLYGLGTRFGVSALSKEAARKLVTEPVRGRLIYTSEAMERTVYLTARQPYLLQCLCNRIFDMAAQLKIRSVSLDLVNQAAEELVKDNEHFAYLWDSAEIARRRFILMLCHKEAAGPDPLQLGVIQERLLQDGIEVSDETLIEDLEFLQELELVELTGSITGGRYMLAVPLMGIWMEHQQDMAAVLRRAQMETEDLK